MDIGSVGFFPVNEILTGFFVSTAITVVGLAWERRDTPFFSRVRARLFNILYLLPASLLQHLLMPLGAIAAVMIGGTAGGLIALPSTGWAIVPGVLVYLLAMDLGEYLFHRAQHRIPFLWSMHSFHHSDPDLNISTTTRHFWLEHLIKSVTVYLAVGMIFKVGAVVATSYALLTFYNYFAHMNVRVGFGRFAWILNSPQFHRVHHSRLAQHHDCNFAGLLPLFDCLFGTYRRPDPGAFPPTGLDTGDVPGSVLEALAWPVRRMTLFRIPSSAAPKSAVR